MIVAAAPWLPPAEAARRAIGGLAGGFWISSPNPAGWPRELVSGPVRWLTGYELADLTVLEATWAELRARWSRSGPVPAGIPVAAGWFSYELGRRLVGLPPDPRAAGQPLFQVHLPAALWIGAGPGEAMLVGHATGALQVAAAALSEPRAGEGVAQVSPLQPMEPPERFLAGVHRIRAYEEAGDAYQVNLSRRLAAASSGDPLSLAVQLRQAAPAPFAFYFRQGGQVILGNSPECFLSLSADGVVETRPIKGTRPRGATPDDDRAAVAALLASPKDRAEHVMIVDLERNDLGRVCRAGSVAVAALGRLVSLPTVHHLESTVRGVLRPEVGLGELLAATFPGGSITGAPKRRAMQIIDELEGAPRGVYTGATGWLGAAGDLELAVAIRTATLNEGRLELSVGAGIVIDSSAEDELAETQVKARAFASLASAAAPA
ncbi:MAG TPA: anthranilate synthase component I family protein [Polyangia bacterium]|nr:anthranilate synthase component I family protein [Polyangia bacterium]